MKHVLLSDIPNDTDLKVYLSKFINEGKFELVFHYDSSFKSTPRMRMFMDALFDIYEIDLKNKNRLVLVSDELNNNAVEHGTGDCWENQLFVSVEKRETNIHINIEVTDCGNANAEEMEKLKEEKTRSWFEKHRSIRGRGLFLITDKIVDSLYFKDAEEWGLIVWVEKTI